LRRAQRKEAHERARKMRAHAREKRAASAGAVTRLLQREDDDHSALLTMLPLPLTLVTPPFFFCCRPAKRAATY